MYRGKKVVVMGLGLHGGGLPVAQWFFAHGAEVIVTDLKKRHELLVTIEALDAYCRSYRLARADQRFISLEYALGGHRERDFRNSDLVVQNPAVPRESEFLRIARESNIPIENETSLFFALTRDIQKLGVTGTRGKSTTTTLLHEMIRCAYPDSQITSVALPSGSKGGFEVLDAAHAAQKREYRTPVVMELSSWQLEGLEPHRMSPNIAVVTNVSSDHLNRYADMDEYCEAKKTIFQHQQQGDCAVFNYDNPITRQWGREALVGKRYWFSRTDGDSIERGAYVKDSALWMRDEGNDQQICLVSDIKLLGAHNVENALAALCGAWAYGITADDIRKGILAVRGIPSRLEYLGTIGGRALYNDTTATSPEGTRAALNALSSDIGHSIILIAGGSDKGLDFSDFVLFLPARGP